MLISMLDYYDPVRQKREESLNHRSSSSDRRTAALCVLCVKDTLPGAKVFQHVIQENNLVLSTESSPFPGPTAGHNDEIIQPAGNPARNRVHWVFRFSGFLRGTGAREDEIMSLIPRRVSIATCARR